MKKEKEIDIHYYYNGITDGVGITTIMGLL